MSKHVLRGKNTPINLWTPVAEVESQALDQLKNIAALPWIAHLAVMPDVHFGKGATVGSVIAMRGAVSPAAVGVDIGCGMLAVKTDLPASRLPDNLKKIRSALEVAIPVGFNDHAERTNSVRNSVELPTRNAIDKLMGRFGDLTNKVADLESKALRQLGTLGGGNHFIELCVDDGVCSCVEYTEDGSDWVPTENCPKCNSKGKADQMVWLMLHSGSRNVGKTLAEYHMAIAKGLAHNQELPDRDLAVFLAKTPEMTAYRHDLYWAQDYAHTNRMIMLDLYKEALREFWPGMKYEPAIQCHHNYVSEETHFDEHLFVTRKGAIRAGVGEMGIIPGSMGTRSFIVRGKGSLESLSSASHGAGRRMSRSKAKQKYTLEDFAKATNGVECRKDQGVLDEGPYAYKKIEDVMANQSDLVQIVAGLKQVVCVKG